MAQKIAQEIAQWFLCYLIDNLAVGGRRWRGGRGAHGAAEGGGAREAGGNAGDGRQGHDEVKKLWAETKCVVDKTLRNSSPHQSSFRSATIT